MKPFFETLTDAAAGAAFASVILLCIWYNHQSPAVEDTAYKSSIICNNSLDTKIVAEHTRITMKGSAYFIERADGHVMIFEKDAFSWCAVLLDSDVKIAPAQPVPNPNVIKP